MPKYDAIVVGLGAMGAAATYQLAKRGAKVLGIDKFDPPHIHGSTHGETRVTRLAIGEGAQYTPLAIRSHQIWRELERETGSSLLEECGGLIISSVGETAKTHVDGFFDKTVAAARQFNIAHELLDAPAIRNRFPQFRVRDDEMGYFEPTAGFVRPEECVRVQLELAKTHGAEIHTGEKILGFEPSDSGVAVATDHGTYSAGQLILAAGAWLPELIGQQYTSSFRIYRQVQLWFAIDGASEVFAPGRFPVFIWELQGSKYGIYGFPSLDGATVKVATEKFESTTTPKTCDRDVSPQEIAFVHDALLAPHVRGLSNRRVKTATCLYTVTPDSHFVIDRLPEADSVIIASPCSGHGFKHSAAIGEALAQMATDGKSRQDISPFTLARFRT